MHIFVESFWVWGLIAAILFIMGIVWFQNTGKIRGFLGFTLSSLFVFGLGLFLVFAVQTDRKDVRKTITKLAQAIASNDVDGVLEYVDEDAYDTVEKARTHMGLAKIEWTKVRDFRIININYFTPEPLAAVTFRGSVGGIATTMDTPFSIMVQFTEVELIKNSEDGQWRVTDTCRFSYPGYRN